MRPRLWFAGLAVLVAVWAVVLGALAFSLTNGSRNLSSDLKDAKSVEELAEVVKDAKSLETLMNVTFYGSALTLGVAGAATVALTWHGVSEFRARNGREYSLL